MEKLPINWRNGMKVNQNHFIGMEQAMRVEMLKHFSAFVTSYNYGILPSKSSSSSIDWFLKLDQSKLSLNVSSTLTLIALAVPIF